MTLRALAGLFVLVSTTAGACSLANAPDDVVPKDDGSGGAGATGGGPNTSSSSESTGGSTACQTADDCRSLADACHVGTCKNGKCEAEPANAGGPCDDANACTDDDVCGADGTCAGVEKTCPAPTDPCQVGVCDPDTGQCKEAAGNDGAPCDDNNGCTEDGTCAGGTCTPGPNACTHSDTCGFEFCDAMTKTCKVQPMNEGLPCDVDNPCSDSTCVAGTCVPNPINEGHACDDGQPCTYDAKCVAGVCTPGTTCPQDTSCGTWSCDTVNDKCVLTPQNEGGGCNDQSSCTNADQCTAGVCTGNYVPQIYFKEDFKDNSQGWILGPEWQIGPAKESCCATVPETADPGLDHTPTDDNGLAGVAIGGNASTALHGYYYLESPPFDTAQAPQQVVLGFYRWLNSDYDPYMHNQIQVFNGTSWVTIWQSGGAPVIQDSPPKGTGWTYVQHDITAYKNANMRIRFGFDIAASGVYEIGSWNIDDVLVSSLGCP